MNAEKWHYLYNSFVETFIKKQYKWLSQNLKYNTTVFDFGAQAGDSSFYLLQNNERKINRIYAYEPDIEFYNLLIENLKETDNNKIEPVFSNAPEPFRLRKDIEKRVDCG